MIAPRLAAAFAALLALVAAPAADAMSVTPIVIDMGTIGRDGRTQISVTNTAAADIPVSLSVAEATVSETGDVSVVPVEDAFVIFPLSAVIKPRETQRFRLRWAGDPALARSRTFVVSVAQQPVQLPEGQSGIQVLYNFEVVVSVAPPRGRPALDVKEAAFATVDGARRLSLTVSNPTNTHAYLSGSRLDVEARDAAGSRVWSRTYTPQELAQSIGVGLVQPGATRRFILTDDVPAGGSVVQASVRHVGRE